MVDKLTRRKLVELGLVAAGGLVAPSFSPGQVLAQVPSIDRMGFPNISGLGDVDPITGDLATPENQVKLMNIFYGGMGNDEGVFSSELNPLDENFVALRLELKRLGWRLADSLHFKFGKRGLDVYSSSDTMIDPNKNISHSLEDDLIWQKEYSRARFNRFGFSLGSIMALAAAMESPDKTAGLFLFSPPVKGVEYSLAKAVKLSAGKVWLSVASKRFFFGEEVSNFMYKRWEDTLLKARIDHFGKDFVASGKPLMIARAIDDPIFGPKSTEIEGATYIDLTAGSVDLSRIMQAHSQSVRDKNIAKLFSEKVGLNPNI